MTTYVLLQQNVVNQETVKIIITENNVYEITIMTVKCMSLVVNSISLDSGYVRGPLEVPSSLEDPNGRRHGIDCNC